MVWDILRGQGEDSENCELNLLVPNTQAGGIIGKGGATLTDIRTRSQAQVQMKRSEEMPHGSLDRLITISGESSRCQQAQQLITDMLVNIPVRSPAQGQSPRGGGAMGMMGMGGGMGGGMGMGGMGMGGMGMGGMGGGMGMKFPKQLFVPDAGVGRVIGKGGSHLRSVRERTGALVVVANESGEDGQRCITITGTAEQVRLPH